jgi:hypothetical protein
VIRLLQKLGLLAQKPPPLSPEARAYVEERLALHLPPHRRPVYVGEGTFRAYLEKIAERAVAKRAKRAKQLSERNKQ